MFALLPHQLPPLEALSETRANGHSSALIVMASGLGKTVVLAHEAKRLLVEMPDARILFLCHQNVILDQAHATFKAVIRPELPTASYGDFHGGTTKTFHEVSLLFASMQSMVRWKDTFKPDEFDYVLVDESHHSQAPTYRPVIEYFTPKFTVAVTATPDRADLKDIRALYGNEVFSLPLEDALAQGLLTPVEYRLVTDEIIETGKLPNPAGMTIKQLNRLLFVPKRDEEIAEIIAKRSADVPNARTVIFCPSIKYAEHLSQFIPDSLPYHSGVPGWQQEVRLNLFRRGEITTMLTVDKFNEGIDIPEANVIVFLRSTASRTVFFQQLGRGLRKLPGKERVLVLDFVANCERLEMVQELSHQLSESQQFSTDNEEVATFSLNLGDIDFDERALNILDVIQRIRGGYSRELLIGKLKDLAVRIGRRPIGRDVSSDPDMPRLGTYLSMFGSFSKALMAAGFRPRRNGWSRAEALEKLKAASAELGRPITMAEVKSSDHLPSGNWLQKEFGGLTLALREAGVHDRLAEYSRDDLTTRLKAFASKLGRTPLSTDLKNHPDMPSTSLYFQHFGTWNNALSSAGITEYVRADRSEYSDDELLEALKAAVDTLGRPPTQRELNGKNGFPSAGQYHARFGGLRSAFEKAGISTDHLEPFSDEVMISRLRSYIERLGHIPSIDEANAEAKENGSLSWATTYIKRFGKWSTALTLAGADDLNRKFMIADLKTQTERLGRRPTIKDIRNLSKEGIMKSPDQYRHIFGALKAAFVEAGLL